MEVILAFLGVILTLLFLIVIRWIIRRSKIHRCLKKYGIPGPKPDFFAGNMYQLQKEPTPNDIIDTWFKKYGDVFGYFMGEDIYVVIKDLEMLTKVFIKDFSIFINKPKFLMETEPRPKMLTGLRGKRWKEVRHIITPAFTTGKIKHLTDVVTRKVDLMVAIIVEKANNGEMFNIHEVVQGLTLDVISACALGINKKILENPKDDLLLAMRNVMEHHFNSIEEMSLLLPFLSKFFHLFEGFSTYKKAVNTVVAHLKTVIRERRQNPNLRNFDIFQSLLDSCDGSSEGNATTLTEEEVVANALTMHIAGFKTTTNAISFTFSLLTTHPDIQERLYQEVKQARDTSYSTLTSLIYLDQVCSEALRLYPPVTGFISRTGDVDYDLGPCTIPKGATVLAPVWNIHHDPDLWPDPYKFDPDRFLPSNKAYIQSMAYFPFGAGPRNCIGSRFALVVMKMAIVKVLQNVKLEPCEKTENPVSLVCKAFTIFPTNGVWVKAVPRQ